MSAETSAPETHRAARSMQHRGDHSATNTAAGLGVCAAARREELGLTQADLAQRIGLSREWVIRFERGNPGANLEGVLTALTELQLELNLKAVSVGSRSTARAAQPLPARKRVAPATPAPPLTEKPVFAAPSYLVVDSLGQLHGPTEGEVSLPKRILWNPSRPFDLSDDKRAATLLRLVLLEARKIEDLEKLVNAELLKRLWHRVHLPEYVRAAWEERFPELAEHQERAHA